ncbi:hypothetical protein ALC62_13252 [Cyphomyrmex costatus]|uniref:Uncharacterized protein n=1 Tax=Cyphomyrmex costatus TaxID=456900 RepID=A0A195C6E0_9HYME|nr:hypothetical protein ALC62_13252 [Cyphomyrmex costatus]
MYAGAHVYGIEKMRLERGEEERHGNGVTRSVNHIIRATNSECNQALIESMALHRLVRTRHMSYALHPSLPRAHQAAKNSLARKHTRARIFYDLSA